MLHRTPSLLLGMPASLQNIIKTNHITFDIRVRILYGITHSSLGRQIHYNVRTIRGKEFRYHSFIRNTAPNKLKTFLLLQNDKPLLLQTHIIIAIHVIQSSHAAAFPQQAP